jgi:cell division protein FtsL
VKVDWAECAAVAVLSVSVVATGLVVVAAKHESRRLFAELEELKRETDRLEIDWWRLQIEQSTFATHPRVETLARERLELRPPSDAQIVIIARPEQ